MKKIVIILLSILATGFTIGLIVGKAQSPQFTQIRHVEDYIEKQSHYSCSVYLIAGKYNPETQTTSLSRVQKYAVAFCGGRNFYVYNELKDKVDTVLNFNYEPEYYKNGLSADDWSKIFTLAGIPVGVKLVSKNSIMPIMKSENGWAMVTAITGSVLCFGLGYELGYDDNGFDPNSELFQKVLRNKLYWKGLIEKYKYKNVHSNLKSLN